MPHTDLRLRLTAEETALLDEAQKKFPEIDFAVQKCTPARFNNIMRYMQLARWEPAVQRLLALTGFRWRDVHLVIAAISRSRGDYMRARLLELGEDWVPPCLTDELKPLAERADPDGDPDAMANELIKALNDKRITEIERDAAIKEAVAEKERADKAEKRADEAFAFISKMQEQMNQSNEQWRESVGQFLAAHAAEGNAKKKHKPGDDTPEFGQVEDLTEAEIDAKLLKREERQADRAAEDEAARKRAAYKVMRPAFPDADKFFRMLDELGSYAKFKDAYAYCLVPYIQQGDYLPAKLAWMVQAEQLHPWCTGFNGSVNPESLTKYLREAYDDYLSGAAKS